MLTLWNKFIAAIVAFLLLLFPNWGGLQYLHLQQTHQ
jgi:hypothetical protein